VGKLQAAVLESPELGIIIQQPKTNGVPATTTTALHPIDCDRHRGTINPDDRRSLPARRREPTHSCGCRATVDSTTADCGETAPPPTPRIDLDARISPHDRGYLDCLDNHCCPFSCDYLNC